MYDTKLQQPLHTNKCYNAFELRCFGVRNWKNIKDLHIYIVNVKLYHNNNIRHFEKLNKTFSCACIH
jgi:hypothetical protein